MMLWDQQRILLLWCQPPGYRSMHRGFGVLSPSAHRHGDDGDGGGIRGRAEGDAVAAAAAAAGSPGAAQGLRPGGRLRAVGRALARGARPPRQGHRGTVPPLGVPSQVDRYFLSLHLL